MAPELATDRLVLRPFQAEDLPAFVAYRRDPLVARYQSWDETYSLADAEAFLCEVAGVRLGQAGEWMQLAIVDPADGTLLGDCASRVTADPPRTAEVGVTLSPAHHGRGYAGEALRKLVDTLFDDHDVRRVIAQIDDRNTAAQRLVEGLGFRLEARFVEADWFKGEWATLRVYAQLSGDAGAAAIAARPTRPPGWVGRGSGGLGLPGRERQQGGYGDGGGGREDAGVAVAAPGDDGSRSLA
jgi:RimJ/RimL family protein N-acetyltransferase